MSDVSNLSLGGQPGIRKVGKKPLLLLVVGLAADCSLNITIIQAVRLPQSSVSSDVIHCLTLRWTAARWYLEVTIRDALVANARKTQLKMDKTDQGNQEVPSPMRPGLVRLYAQMGSWFRFLRMLLSPGDAGGRASCIKQIKNSNL